DKCPVCLDFSAYPAILLHIAPDKICGGACCRCAVADTEQTMAQGRKLTETAIAKATVPPSKRQLFLWDSAVPGFGLRVLAGGSKTVWFMYRPPGGRSVNSRMVRIRPWHPGSLKHARRRAKDLAGAVVRGDDPAAMRQAERAKSETMLRALLAEGGPYQRDLARRSIVNAKQAMSSLRRGLARLMSREVAQLTRRDLVAAIAAIEDDGRPGAAQALRKLARP